MSANSPWTVDELDEMIRSAEQRAKVDATGHAAAELRTLRTYRERAEFDAEHRDKVNATYLEELRQELRGGPVAPADPLEDFFRRQEGGE